MRKTGIFLAASALIFLGASVSYAASVDSQLPKYAKVSGISGNLNSVGSDTLNNLMTLWAEGFAKHYPNVKIQIEGKGSSTAPPALIEGTAHLGPMSRPMKSKEIDAFEAKYGYKPTVFRVALDALAVYVNKDNPISFMTMEQVDSIFSTTRNLGGSTDITTWRQLGLTGAWDKPVSIYGRNSASGTYGYFREIAMGKGDYKPVVKEQPGSAAVVEGVTNDLFGIGYSGVGYKTAGVKALPLTAKGSVEAFAPVEENVYSGDYPLSRYLYVYVNKAPGQGLDPLTSEFLKFVLSQEGQEQVIKDGYVPLVWDIAKDDLAEL
ncbi:MAG: phosphate ABC transporter substrate-binding protein PstS family protein [Candidatus Omnitrophica bacterium]|nr:phosphate ABC transporter substrate-binding protein PstS family protein [Candidatus Omnitrophota bacterium]